MRAVVSIVLLSTAAYVVNAPPLNSNSEKINGDYRFEVNRADNYVNIEFPTQRRTFKVDSWIYDATVKMLTDKDKRTIWDNNKIMYDGLQIADVDNNGLVSQLDLIAITILPNKLNNAKRWANSHIPGRFEVD